MFYFRRMMLKWVEEYLDSYFGSFNLFFSLFPDTWSPIFTAKSKICKRTLDPVWNQSIIYSKFSVATSDPVLLNIRVFDDDLIGKVSRLTFFSILNSMQITNWNLISWSLNLNFLGFPWRSFSWIQSVQNLFFRRSGKIRKSSIKAKR